MDQTQQLSEETQTLIQQSQQVKSNLEAQVIVVYKDGVKIVMTGGQFVKEVAIDGQPSPKVAEAINEAIQKTQTLGNQALLDLSVSLTQNSNK